MNNIFYLLYTLIKWVINMNYHKNWGVDTKYYKKKEIFYLRMQRRRIAPAAV